MTLLSWSIEEHTDLKCLGTWDHIWGMGERCGLKVAKLWARDRAGAGGGHLAVRIISRKNGWNGRQNRRGQKGNRKEARHGLEQIVHIYEKQVVYAYGKNIKPFDHCNRYHQFSLFRHIMDNRYSYNWPLLPFIPLCLRNPYPWNLWSQLHTEFTCLSARLC